NLINNSIKFLPRERGFILITTKLTKNQINEKSYEMIEVSITDNGSGIDSEMFSKLFTKFATKSFHGIGLGLYISKSIIEAHGGRIWAKNNSVRQGATFSFVIPLDNFDQSDDK